MKVKAKTGVRYNDISYPAGAEFEVTAEEYEKCKSVLVAVEEEKAPESDLPPGGGLSDLTVPELRKLAEEKNVENFDKLKKAELISALEADGDGGPGDTENPPVYPAAGEE